MTKADRYLLSDIFNILKYGYKDENPRPKYSDGTPAHTFSVNHNSRKYDLSKNEFPICTARPIAWKSAIKELLWIYVDQTSNLDVLREKYNVHYWDEWESKDRPGSIGVRYGETVKKHNLLNQLLEGIKNDPFSRRHIISLWQEDDFKESDGLMPCAFLTQFNVRKSLYGEKYLDMLLYQRSGDMLVASGAGNVNEVQYAAFLMMVAHCTGYKPGIFTHIVCNEQIYDRHTDSAKEIYNRLLHNSDMRYFSINQHSSNLPYLKFTPKTNNFYDITIDDFEMVNYKPQKPQIKFDLGI